MTGRTELWEPPSPSSSFLEGVTFIDQPQRVCGLSFSYEKSDGDQETCELRFRDVVAYKCTYLPALTAQMIRSAYDKLVDVGSSEWLREAVGVSQDEGPPLRHLRICFDDGPCYEFLCGGFETAKS